MTYLTKQRVREIINDAPEGTTPEGIVSVLRQKGYELEGYSIEKKETEDKKITSSLGVNKFLDGIGGIAVRALEVPSTIATTAAKTTGAVAGSLLGGDKEIAIEELRKGTEELKGIYPKVAKGYEEGFFADADFPEPAEALGKTGLEGFVINVAGDPLNLLFGGKAVREVIAKSKTQAPLLQRFGEGLYQSLLRPPVKSEVKQFKQLGKTIEGVIKTETDILGRRLSQYNIRGDAKKMISEMNQRIPILSKELNNAVKTVKQPVKTDNIIKKLDKLANSYSRVGKKGIARQIKAKVKQIQKEISASEALDLKRIYDDLRLTSAGALSEAKSVEQRTFKIISDGFRGELNRIPEIGKLNKEMSTYSDAIEAMAKVAVKDAQKGISPLKINQFFPYVRLNFGSLAKTKTTAGNIAIELSKVIDIPQKQIEQLLRTISPSALRNIFKQDEE